MALEAAVVFALTAALFLVLYQYDNKYTSERPVAESGVLSIQDGSLRERPVFLVDGWEYYGGKLLTPDSFSADRPVPDEYIYIGQFGGFEKWNNGNPHGSASYRLNIRVPEQPEVYLLELPEIFSAYRLYINGKLLAQMGQPEKTGYFPQTGNRAVSVEAGENIEILFAVSDYSHFYSGIVYPPAFGLAEPVSRLLGARLVFRSILCAAALTAGLLSILIGLLAHRNALALLFGLACLFFTGYTVYPLTRTLLSGVPVQYAVERVSFCAMLLISGEIAVKMSGLSRKWSIPFLCVSGLVCAASAAMHLTLPLGNLNIMLLYSMVITVYEWVAAGFIACAVMYAVSKGSAQIAPLFYGAATFVCALAMDRILPAYEPILTGWFVEIASFLLMLWIGAATGQDVANRYRESAVLEERANSMERLYVSGISHLRMLKLEMNTVKTLRHDMRHHLTLIDGYVRSGRYEKLTEYIKEYGVSVEDGELLEYCPIDVINVLTHHYSAAACHDGIKLEIRCDLGASPDPGYTAMSDADLCCLYCNLLENAVEACRRIQSGAKTIRITVFRIAPEVLNIYVFNTAEGIRRTGRRFLSSKQEGRSGYGLSSIETIAAKYGGGAEFRWNAARMEFESRVSVTA